MYHSTIHTVDRAQTQLVYIHTYIYIYIYIHTKMNTRITCHFKLKIGHRLSKNIYIHTYKHAHLNTKNIYTCYPQLQNIDRAQTQKVYKHTYLHRYIYVYT